MGEYLGRVLYMQEGNRLRAVALTIVASISQVIVTLGMGWVALLLLLRQDGFDRIIGFPWNRMVIWGTLLVLLLTLVFYLRLSWVVKWLSRLPLLQRFNYLIDALADFDPRILFRLLGISALRFLVFILQYHLAFRLFGVDIGPGETFLGASVNFLVMAMIPSVAIADVGLRAEVGLRIFGLYSANALGITIASAGIWFLNLILPAVAGSLLLLGIRKFWKISKAHSAGKNLSA